MPRIRYGYFPFMVSLICKKHRRKLLRCFWRRQYLAAAVFLAAAVPGGGSVFGGGSARRRQCLAPAVFIPAVSDNRAMRVDKKTLRG